MRNETVRNAAIQGMAMPLIKPIRDNHLRIASPAYPESEIHGFRWNSGAGMRVLAPAMAAAVARAPELRKTGAGVIRDRPTPPLQHEMRIAPFLSSNCFRP